MFSARAHNVVQSVGDWLTSQEPSNKPMLYEIITGWLTRAVTVFNTATWINPVLTETILSQTSNHGFILPPRAQCSLDHTASNFGMT